MFRTIRRCAQILALIFAGAFTSIAHAHNPGLSSAKVTVEDSRIEALLAFNDKEVEAALGDEGISRPVLEALGRRALALSLDGAPLEPSQVLTSTGENNDVEFRVTLPRPTGTTLRIKAALFAELASGHRQLLEVRNRGVLLQSALLNAGHPSVEILLTDSASPSAERTSHTFAGFLKLGIEHILTGYDHLLFLCGLLLVCERFGSAVRIITCFTIAHSITLALATFDLVTLPSRLVESVIAASIVYVGIENIVHRKEIRWREWLTFAFGLVHGLGFASVLREVGVGSGGSGVAVPLASFNLGVELGQLSIAAIVLPLIWQLRKQPAFLKFGAPALSLLIALAGAYWFFERVFGA